MSEDMKTETKTEDSRREFLKKYGRLAAVTPPAMAVLLSTNAQAGGICKSGGRPPMQRKKKKPGGMGMPKPKYNGMPRRRT